MALEFSRQYDIDTCIIRIDHVAHGIKHVYVSFFFSVVVCFVNKIVNLYMALLRLCKQRDMNNLLIFLELSCQLVCDPIKV